MKAKVWLVTIGLVILGLGVVGCASSTPTPVPTPVPTVAPPPTQVPPTAAPTPAPATKAPVPTTAPTAAPVATPTQAAPVKVGVSLPLTGDLSEPGTAAKQGYELWADVVNKAGGLLGRQVKLTIYDNASNPDTAVADYERLITQDKVDLVVGPYSSRLVIPTSEVAAKYGYAFPEPAGGAPHVFDRGLKNLFFAQPGSLQAPPFNDLILIMPAATRPKTFAIVTADDPIAKATTDDIKNALTKAGIQLVLTETYAPDTKDFSSIAAKVADKNPDLIVGGTFFADSVAQIKAYIQAGYQPRGAYFMTGPSLPKEFREALGKSADGIFSSITWFEGSAIETNPEFVKAYHAKYGAGEIAEDVANAYTVGQVLQQAVENIKSIDNAKLIAEMHKSTFKTVVGPLSFDELGRPKGTYLALQWQGDSYVIVSPANAKQKDMVWPKAKW